MGIAKRAHQELIEGRWTKDRAEKFMEKVMKSPEIKVGKQMLLFGRKP